jgi:hypothetical protein
MKRSTPPLIKHQDHEVEIRLATQANHAARIHCVTCNKFVMWLSHKETELAEQQGLINYEPAQ